MAAVLMTGPDRESTLSAAEAAAQEFVGPQGEGVDVSTFAPRDGSWSPDDLRAAAYAAAGAGASGRRAIILAGIDVVRERSLDILLKTLEDAPDTHRFFLTAARPLPDTLMGRVGEVVQVGSELAGGEDLSPLGRQIALRCPPVALACDRVEVVDAVNLLARSVTDYSGAQAAARAAAAIPQVAAAASGKSSTHKDTKDVEKELARGVLSACQQFQLDNASRGVLGPGSDLSWSFAQGLLVRNVPIRHCLAAGLLGVAPPR